MLRAAGFHVVALRSPIGATQAIVRQKARVVVVDVFMPTLRGDRLLTLLRKNQRLGHLGIILMSGHAERELDPLQLELQADAVVAKRHLDRLPALVKRLAAREFTLGVEALERFVAHEPLARVHECVFGVLALETEPVDPRL